MLILWCMQCWFLSSNFIFENGCVALPFCFFSGRLFNISKVPNQVAVDAEYRENCPIKKIFARNS